MLLRHSLGLTEEADAIERAVREVIADGARTADMVAGPAVTMSTTQIGELIRIARERKVAVPNLERLKAIIEEVEQGRRPQAWHNLDDLAPVS